MTTAINPRSIGVEVRYLNANVLELAELRRRLLDSGTTAPVANGIIGWLTTKIAGHPDVSSSQTRAAYRKVLAELDGSGGPPGKAEGRRHNRPADNPRSLRYDAVGAVAA